MTTQMPQPNVSITFSDSASGRTMSDSCPPGWTLGKYCTEKKLTASTVRVRKSNGDILSDPNTLIENGDTITNTPSKLSGSCN